MQQHLPALQVVIPLFGALLAAISRRPNPAWLIALVVSFAMPVIAALLLWQVTTVGPISYHIGSWPPEIGIEYRVDVVNALLLMLVSIIGAVTLPYARKSVAAEVDADKVAWFYTLYLLSMCGLLGISITNDAFNAFVFLEISSLSSYALIAMGRDRRALIGAYQYLIMGTIGATFYVIGVALLFVMTGSLNLTLIAERLADVETTRPVLAALAFIIVGISLKLALFPLHVWLPNAYAFAPSVVTIFLAGTATKVAVYLFIRYIYSVFGAGFIFTEMPITVTLVALSVAAMFGASTVAIFQSNIKRLLAYSSVGQIGYITLGVALATQTGLTGGLVHVVNHALMKAALFMAIGAVFFRAGTVRIEDLAGIGRRMPYTMAAFLVAGLSLIGVPGTVGFISKWYLVVAAFQIGWWWLGILVVASSLLALVYIGRVIEVAWFRPTAAGLAKVEEAPFVMLATTWIMAGTTVYFGIDADMIVGPASRAADVLISGLR